MQHVDGGESVGGGAASNEDGVGERARHCDGAELMEAIQNDDGQRLFNYKPHHIFHASIRQDSDRKDHHS
jgi:hypothetical protein